MASAPMATKLTSETATNASVWPFWRRKFLAWLIANPGCPNLGWAQPHRFEFAKCPHNSRSAPGAELHRRTAIDMGSSLSRASRSYTSARLRRASSYHQAAEELHLHGQQSA